MLRLTRPDKAQLPGLLVVFLVTIPVALWAFWGAAEMFFEGWGTGLTTFAYLIPFALSLLLALVALRWPRFGGWLIIVAGTVFTVWVFNLQMGRGAAFSWQFLLSWFPVTILLALTGILFILEGRYRRSRQAAGWRPPASWVRRHWQSLVVAGLPTIVVLGVVLYWLPTILTRQDDGDRSARLIEGNGVSLVWAPAGPGWNWKQDFGGYPSWNSIAFYGVEPIGMGKNELNGFATVEDMAVTGLCSYLTEDGVTLLPEPAYIWRFPTVDEIVRTLALHGENAGCTWDGTDRWAECLLRPDKETPLWAPNQEPVYMWALDEANSEDAYYVSYQGAIGSQPKNWGNPRHGFRCVHD